MKEGKETFKYPKNQKQFESLPIDQKLAVLKYKRQIAMQRIGIIKNLQVVELKMTELKKVLKK